MATFAEKMVAALEARMLELAGVKKTSGGGETVELADLKVEHAYWERKVARQQGRRPFISPLDLRGGC